MNIETVNKNNIKIFYLKGDFTITSLQEFQDNVFPALDEPIEILGIDMAEVSFIDSSGIGKLVQITNLSKNKNKKLYLIDIQGRVLQLLKSVRLDSFFTITDKYSFAENYLI
jgi:anti-anti-sigma factor